MKRTPLELRFIELMNAASHVSREREPHRYIRLRVRSEGKEFFLYQPSKIAILPTDDPGEAVLKACDGSVIGHVKGDLYWQYLFDHKRKAEATAQSQFMA